jgi:hypothetical protein
VYIAGELSVDIIPYAATQPEHVVPLYSSDSASIGAYSSRRAWAGSVAQDVLPAAGQLPVPAWQQLTGIAANDSANGAQPADVFLRLRFCPSSIQAQQLAVVAGRVVVPPDFLGFSASDVGGSSDAASPAGPQLLMGGTAAPADELAAAAGDGGASSAAASSAAAACTAPVPLPPGATAEQCAAAKRLLGCSESLVLLTEPKDSQLAPANVSARLVPAVTVNEPGFANGTTTSRAAPGSAQLVVELSSAAVALFVAVDNQQTPGRFNGSGTLLLLPWERRTVAFEPVPPDGTYDGANVDSDALSAAGSNGTAAVQPAAELGQLTSFDGKAGQLNVLDDFEVPAAEQAGQATAENQLLPGLSVYWLQKEMATLQPSAAAAASGGEAASGTSSSIMSAAMRWWPLALASSGVLLVTV